MLSWALEQLFKAGGLEIMQSLRNATNNAPVVVMTAFGDLQTAVQAVQQGAIEYLNKPFGLEEALHSCWRDSTTKL